MQIDRLFQIVYLLLERRTITAKELAKHFGVSVRTIYRDIDTLSAANIPLYSTQGRGGGISILDGFVLNKATLNQDEQNQILLALQSMAATGQTQAQDTLAKLGGLFQKSNTNWIEVDFSRWGQSSQDNCRFELLKSAILDGFSLRFAYVSASGEHSKRSVYPLKLIFKSKAWYLQGFCQTRQDYRTFKINRMLGILMTDEHFIPRDYSPPPIEGGDSSSPALIDLEFQVPANFAHRLYDEFDEGSIEQSDDGSYHVFVQLPQDEWLRSYILSFGNHIKIISPPHMVT